MPKTIGQQTEQPQWDRINRLVPNQPETITIDDAKELLRLQQVGSPSDVWRASEGKRLQTAKNLGRLVLNTGMDFLPGLGDVKSAQEAITGRQPMLEGVPGVESHLSIPERIGAGIGALPFIPSMAGILKKVNPSEGSKLVKKVIESTPKAEGGKVKNLPDDEFFKILKNAKEVIDKQLASKFDSELVASVVKNDNGNLLKVFHGTTSEFKDFSFETAKRANPNISGDNDFGPFFTTNKSEADFYAQGGHYGKNYGKARTIEAYLDITNPVEVLNSPSVIIDRYPKLSIQEIKDKLISEGYDGIHVKGEKGKNSYYIPFNLEQIHIIAEPKTIKEKLNALRSIESYFKTSGRNVERALLSFERDGKDNFLSKQAVNYVKSLFFESPNPSRPPESGLIPPKTIKPRDKE